ncbi:MAG: class II aldolase/adducin family protein [Rickettsiaceae bacterium]
MDDKIRKNLAYAYKIFAKLGLDDHTYTHLSARPKGADYYYIYPFGYLFDEVTPECLLKVSLDGEVIEGKEQRYNETGYITHGSIYRERPELTAVFHLHTVASIAVSAMKQGLLPISQWALHFYEQVNYHEYNSLLLDNSTHGAGLVRDLADKKVMFLRNHGFIACGETIHEALFYCYHLELSCKTQVAALSCNAELIMPSHETCKQTNKDLLGFEKDLGARDWQAWIRFLDKES